MGVFSWYYPGLSTLELTDQTHRGGGSTAVAESGALPPHRGRGRSRHAHSQPDRIITLGVKTTRAAWGGDGKNGVVHLAEETF